MRRFIIITLLLICSLGAVAKEYSIKEIPHVQVENRYRFTSNPDGILSDDAVQKIDQLCYDLRHKAIAQVAVVAVKEIEGDDVFDFAYELFSEWGVGNKSDNGIGILLVEELREIRFVTGYGVEGVLTDALCKRIQTRYMLPHFRKGDYSAGMVAGMEAICSLLNGSELDMGGNDDYQEDETAEITAILIFMLLICIGVPALLVFIDRQSRKCPNCKQIALKKESARIIHRAMGIRTYEDTYVCSKCGAIVKRKRNDYDSTHTNHRGGGPIIMGGGFGQGMGGGSFGGGSFGGGFGGGSFGGGGAGSRW